MHAGPVPGKDNRLPAAVKVENAAEGLARLRQCDEVVTHLQNDPDAVIFPFATVQADSSARPNTPFVPLICR